MASVDLTEEQKADIAIDVKAALKSLTKASMKAANAVAKNSENKVDDVIVPLLSGPAEEAINNLIDGIKL